MKTKNLFSAIALFMAIFIVVSCNKDQTVVKQLDGEWKVTAMKENGTAYDAEDFEGMTYSFESCKVSKGDCKGSVSQGAFKLDFDYNISDKGEKMTIKYNFLGTVISQSATIKEHSKKKFVFEVTDDGDKVETTLEKK
jgi:uncharacterized protein (TIGR03067 family)